MKIVDPEHVVRFEKFQQGPAKNFVYPDIVFPVFLIVIRVHLEIMKERPDCSVAEAVVVIIDVLFRKKNRKGVELVQGSLPYFISPFRFDRVSGPAHPHIVRRFPNIVIVLFQIGTQTCGKPSNAGNEAQIPLFSLNGKGESVGYDDRAFPADTCLRVHTHYPEYCQVWKISIQSLFEIMYMI